MRDIKKYESEYIKESFEDYQVIYRRKKVLEIINKYAPKNILEIGCGMQPIFPYLEFDYESCVIVEPSTLFCQNAVNLSEGDARIECVNECFSAKCVEGKTFDFVICSGLLHEVNNPMDLLNEIKYICNEDTIVHVNVPNAKSVHRILAKEMGLIDDIYNKSERNYLLQQHSVYDLDMLKSCLVHVGFQEIEMGSFFVKPFTHDQMYKMLEEKIIDNKVLDGLYNIVKYMPELGSEIYINAKLV